MFPHILQTTVSGVLPFALLNGEQAGTNLGLNQPAMRFTSLVENLRFVLLLEHARQNATRSTGTRHSSITLYLPRVAQA